MQSTRWSIAIFSWWRAQFCNLIGRSQSCRAVPNWICVSPDSFSACDKEAGHETRGRVANEVAVRRSTGAGSRSLHTQHGSWGMGCSISKCYAYVTVSRHMRSARYSRNAHLKSKNVRSPYLDTVRSLRRRTIRCRQQRNLRLFRPVDLRKRSSNANFDRKQIHNKGLKD